MKFSSPWHLVSVSPWPILLANSIFGMGYGAAFYFWKANPCILLVAFICSAAILYLWLRDVVREATYQNAHTLRVVNSMRLGFILFMVSEVMFFASFFWAYFWSALNPSIQIGGTWPPVGIQAITPWGLPALNTAILLFSGCTVTWAHLGVCGGNKTEGMNGLLATCSLGFIFTCIQTFEYFNAPFTIGSGVYGSCFFILTGFHGLHVIVGTIMLAIAYRRLELNHFTQQRHLGLEIAVWYWHLVDVVWIFVFVFVYIWGTASWEPIYWDGSSHQKFPPCPHTNVLWPEGMNSAEHPANKSYWSHISSSETMVKCKAHMIAWVKTWETYPTVHFLYEHWWLNPIILLVAYFINWFRKG